MAKVVDIVEKRSKWSGVEERIKVEKRSAANVHEKM